MRSRINSTGLLATLAATSINLGAVSDVTVSEQYFTTPSLAQYKDPLLRAIIMVESKGAHNLVGDRGKAVGILQIHKIMVDDVNRIKGVDMYSYEDRLDPDKSIEMYYVYMNHYCENETDEIKARRWNGGPKGDRKESTAKYWRKVEHQLRVLK